MGRKAVCFAAPSFRFIFIIAALAKFSLFIVHNIEMTKGFTISRLALNKYFSYYFAAAFHSHERDYTLFHKNKTYVRGQGNIY